MHYADQKTIMINNLKNKLAPSKNVTEEKIEKTEDALDEALDESFPASDPVAISITPHKVTCK